MTISNIRVSDIVVDAGTQVRAEIHSRTVEEYAEAWKAGADFPPVVVFHDGNRYMLADGFHRVMAAARIERDTVKALVKQGTKSDALKFALSANVSHGLRRSNADKRQCVGLAVTEWPRLSDRAIAEMCGVGADLVGDVRSQLSENDSSTKSETRVGADGRERRMPQPRPESAPVDVTDYPTGDEETASERPHIVTADERFREAMGGTIPPIPKPQSDLFDKCKFQLSELVHCAAKQLDDRQRWQFADSLEDGAGQLRNQ